MPYRMRPLLLPKIVASRQSFLNSSDDSLAAATLDSADSFRSSISECSTPLSPTFSLRGHNRYPSSTSSLASTPPNFDIMAIPATSNNKLPDLREEPVEREEDFVMSDQEPEEVPCLCDDELCPHQTPSFVHEQSQLPPTPEYDLSDGLFGDDGDMHMAKRRRSGESPTNSIATRFGNRFPSLSRRLKDRKRISGLSTSRTSTPSRTPSSRSSSLTGSILPLDRSEVQLPLTPTRSVTDYPNDTATSGPSSSLEIDTAKANAHIDTDGRQPLATTPLLPPMMVDLRASEETPLQSPLQSPTVAESSAAFSKSNTPTGTPQCPGIPTPPLSSKPSIASFRASRPGHLVPSAEIPSLMIADPQDEWAIKLGHANFTIDPEPYLPHVCDTQSCSKLFANWEMARRNFTKHQVRTGEHFGVTSKTYKLTEEKWSEIDAMWKRNNEIANNRAAEIGHEPSPATPIEPAPIAKMPALHDPKNEGKFPKLGDEDIVGPMVQFASQIPSRPSRRSAFFKFFSGMRSPGTLLGRTALGMRSSR